MRSRTTSEPRSEEELLFSVALKDFCEAHGKRGAKAQEWFRLVSDISRGQAGSWLRGDTVARPNDWQHAQIHNAHPQVRDEGGEWRSRLEAARERSFTAREERLKREGAVIPSGFDQAQWRLMQRFAEVAERVGWDETWLGEKLRGLEEAAKRVPSGVRA